MGKVTNLIEALIRIVRLEDDDGYERTTDAAIDLAMRVLHAAEDAWYLPDCVTPGVNGGLSFTWALDENCLKRDADLYCWEDGDMAIALHDEASDRGVLRPRTPLDGIGDAIDQIKKFIERKKDQHDD